jgi:hypothetical protein
VVARVNSFPRALDAATQVLEETGLDIEGLLREQDYIDAQLGDQDTRLFIVQAGRRPAGCPAGRHAVV